jgi:hypothetical protein
MISVLIASYDRDVLALIDVLYRQLTNEHVSFEIICLDDASKSKSNSKNQQVNELPYCTFESLQENIGRSAIRNLLASRANYKWLLFLDADVLPSSAKFISNYLREINTSINPVVLGGIKYRDSDFKNRLRWKFGKKNEEINFVIRNKDPENYFFTANFLIKKDVFDSLMFNEKIRNYGYEDLLFAKELNKNKIKIYHIENEVFHLGIDSNKDFVEKSKQAIHNLAVLVENNYIQKEDTKIYNIYYKLNNFGVVYFLALFTNFFEKRTIQKSSLIFYNLYRVVHLHSILKNRQ